MFLQDIAISIFPTQLYPTYPSSSLSNLSMICARPQGAREPRTFTKTKSRGDELQTSSALPQFPLWMASSLMCSQDQVRTCIDVLILWGEYIHKKLGYDIVGELEKYTPN